MIDRKNFFFTLSLSILSIFLIPEITLAKIVNLNVPFTAQAPEGNWSEPWKNACEETSILMVDSYYTGSKINTKTPTERASLLLKIFRMKEIVYGQSFDEPAAQIADYINRFTKWEARPIYEPTLEEILNEIESGRPVIANVLGREIGNPYFQNGGPLYHVIVLSGFDDEKKEFITEDPGTERGLDFRYSYDKIMANLRDFRPNGGTPNAPRAVVFTSPLMTALSRDTDGDRDGLSKWDEVRHGTILTLQDSDGDGFGDGEEVRNGFLPNLNESRVQIGSLLKSIDSPVVYLLNARRELQPIENEGAFFRRGYRFENVKTLSNAFINYLAKGEMLR